MNKADLQKILLEEVETAINEEELDENFFKKMAAKLRGAKDGGWEAVAAQGDEEDFSSKQGGPADTKKIPVRPMIAKLLGAGLPTKIANELGKEIISQLTNVHGFGEASIQEQAGGLKGVARQPSARRTSSMPSGKKVLDLSAVKIPKNMVQNIENLLSDMFSSYGFRGVKLGQGPEVEPQKKATPSDALETTKSDAEPEKSRLDLIKPPRSMRDIRGTQNYKKFMASLLDFFANESKIDIKIAKNIVRDIWSQTPTSGKFDKIVFKEAIEKEIDIAAILASSGLSPARQIKVLRDLKNWASKNSDTVVNKMKKIKRLQKPDAPKLSPKITQKKLKDVPDYIRNLGATRAAKLANLEEQLKRMQTLAGIDKKVL